MANNTRTVILQRGEERLQLAVNPRQMVISQPQNTLSYVTVRGETVHAARGSGLTQVTLRTFLPNEASRFYEGVSPAEALAMLYRWKCEGVPVRLMISKPVPLKLKEASLPYLVTLMADMELPLI